jgi:hypothetical protein
MTADATGDAKVDLVALNNGSTWVLPSTGVGFGTPAQWAAVPFYGNYVTAPGDVDGDLKADLVAVNNNGVWVMTSTGSVFAAPSNWYNGQA